MLWIERMLHTTVRHPLSGQVLRYGLVVASGYVLAIALYSGELAIGVPPYLGLGIAFVLNGLYNFTLIRIWAFPPSGRSISSDLGRFSIVAGGSFAVNYASFAVLYSAIGLGAATSQRAAILIAAPVTFLGNRLWSFRRQGAPRAVHPFDGPAPVATSDGEASYSR